MAQRSSGFDMSKLTTGSWILLGGGVLLLLDSFIFSWQKVCYGGGLSELLGGSLCGKAGMWSGDAGWAGVIAGLLVIALIVWEAIALAGLSMSLPMAASKISAYIGFATLAFVIIKFLLIMTNHVAFGAFLGLIFALAVGYGAWMRFQEPEVSAAPPPPPPAL
jgi:hypothetical protein